MTPTQPQTAIAAAFCAAADALGLYAPMTVGQLGEGESISLLLAPGGVSTVFFDGSARRRVTFSLICASRSRLRAAEAAAALCNAAPQFLLTAANAVIERVAALSPPQEAGDEPDGRVVFTAAVAVDYITKG